MSKGRSTVLVRDLCLALLAAALLSGCGSQPGGASSPQPYKHVLVITVDTLRADHVRHNAYGVPTTPFVDSLLATGFEFTHAVTPIPRTTQALASLLTGCYPHTTKVRRLWSRMTPEMVSLAQMAKQRGYVTIAVVSNRVLIRKRGLARGFDVYDFAPDTRDATGTTSAAIHHLAKRKPDDAVFVWVHYIDPHVPYFPPPELAERFDPTYTGRYRRHFGALPGGPGNYAYPIDLPKVEAVFQNRLPEEVNAHIRKLYAACVRYTDDEIARLVNRLRGQLGDDWLVVFTSDHGESLGEHDYFYDHGDYVYNATLRVPLGFIFPPGDPLRRRGSSDARVSLVDVMPTLAELLDLPLPTGGGYEIEGRSLVPYLRGQNPSPQPTFAECGRSHYPEMVPRRVSFNVSGRFRAVLADDWKLIWTPGQKPDLEYELYNLRSDPDETENLYSPEHPQSAPLKRLLHAWLRVTDDDNLPPTKEDLEALKALGYVESPGG